MSSLMVMSAASYFKAFFATMNFLPAVTSSFLRLESCVDFCGSGLKALRKRLSHLD
jgi:hypothetical protein